jgi:hypothetical protein
MAASVVSIKNEDDAPLGVDTVSESMNVTSVGHSITVDGILSIVERVFEMFLNCGNRFGEARAKNRIYRLATHRKARRREQAVDYVQAAVEKARPELNGPNRRIIAREIVEDWRVRPRDEFDRLFNEAVDNRVE